MKNRIEKPDSLIFDMDGTLWDALDIYVEAWNAGFKAMGVDKIVGRDDISYMMGWEGRKVLDALLPGYTVKEQDEIYRAVNKERAILINGVKDVLYPGVKEGLKKLATCYRLFIVSNCPEGIVGLFMGQAGITSYFSGHMEYGVNRMPKHHNIQLLMTKYHLKNPVYIGDTAGDEEQSALAGVPFVFLSFGFGEARNYLFRFDDFESFIVCFMEL